MYTTPRKLRRGSRVALIAPSSPFIPKEIMEGMDIMKEEGLVPVLGPCVRNLKSDNIHSAPLKDRVQEFNWAFSDPNVEGVFSVGGGAGCAALLPHVDYHSIRKSRKAFLGISDNVALNNGILAKAGLINFVGQPPCIRVDEGEHLRRADSESFQHTIRLLMSNEEWGTKPFNFNESFPRTLCPGTGRGLAVGGNMDTFVHLIGTPFMPDTVNCVLFLEDVHKNGTSVGRELLHLRLAGVISQANAIVLGEFSEVPNTNDERTPSIERAIKEYLVPGPPCTYGYPFSHGPYTGPIPIGAMCDVDATEGVVNFEFAMG